MIKNRTEKYIIYHQDSNIGYSFQASNRNGTTQVHMQNDYNYVHGFRDIETANKILTKITNDDKHYFTHNHPIDHEVERVKLDKSKLEVRKLVTKYCLRKNNE